MKVHVFNTSDYPFHTLTKGIAIMFFRRSYPRRAARTASSTSSSLVRFCDNPLASIFKTSVQVLVIHGMLASLTGAIVFTPDPVLAAESASSAVSRNYTISTGQLSDVLAQFAAASGVQGVVSENGK